jgi:hypothetical protein
MQAAPLSRHTEVNPMKYRKINRLAYRSAQVVALVCPHELKRALVQVLRQRDPEMAIVESKSGPGTWQKISLPNCVDGFEDLTFLFWNTPMNRGLIRMDFDEAAALFGLVRSKSLRRGVEIGRYTGGSTLLLSAALPEGGLLTSVDIAPRNDEALIEALSKVGARERVILETGDANAVDVDGPLDFVFIDGDHSYQGAKQDHLRWGRKVRKGGYVVHHDMARSRPFASEWPELKQLRADILLNQGNELKLWKEVGSLTMFERTADSWTVF